MCNLTTRFDIENRLSGISHRSMSLVRGEYVDMLFIREILDTIFGSGSELNTRAEFSYLITLPSSAPSIFGDYYLLV